MSDSSVERKKELKMLIKNEHLSWNEFLENFKLIEGRDYNIAIDVIKYSEPMSLTPKVYLANQSVFWNFDNLVINRNFNWRFIKKYFSFKIINNKINILRNYSMTYSDISELLNILNSSSLIDLDYDGDEIISILCNHPALTINDVKKLLSIFDPQEFESFGNTYELTTLEDKISAEYNNKLYYDYNFYNDHQSRLEQALDRVVVYQRELFNATR